MNRKRNVDRPKKTAFRALTFESISCNKGQPERSTCAFELRPLAAQNELIRDQQVFRKAERLTEMLEERLPLVYRRNALNARGQGSSRRDPFLFTCAGGGEVGACVLALGGWVFRGDSKHDFLRNDFFFSYDFSSYRGETKRVDWLVFPIISSNDRRGSKIGTFDQGELNKVETKMMDIPRKIEEDE
ncbi:hypothetical protein KY290_025747 [Solanum tuberosum]|uniref:Uncharacterized protein n=1 Tax=Solanum tuberosum TaxID=4113 RepID=A0ABQ7UUF8_SOLTU|nr:hypothetical protein KY289_024807 [Solanum tuberosum]KAH0676772.1 hypothetical protein KY285_024573 [Solanum tuberosum]KAH0755477.1 hypothetical protein KY290_025747 [Solanum tuberosum]